MWSFKQMVLEQLNIHVQKKNNKELQPILHIIYKIQLTWIIDLNVKLKTTELLDGNTGKNSIELLASTPNPL